MLFGAQGNTGPGAVRRPMIGKVHRVDDQRLAFPLTDRMTLQRAFALAGMRAFHINDPLGRIELIPELDDSVADRHLAQVQIGRENERCRPGDTFARRVQ